MPNRKIAAVPLPWIMSVAAIIVALTGCGPTPAEKARLEKLANVKRVALVCFVGKSKTNPKGNVHRPYLDGMYEAFRAKAAAASIVEFIPVDQVAADKAYRQVAKIQMPEGVLSAVESLTYVRYGVEKGQSYDYGPLARSLGVDALLTVVTEFGVAIRQNASAPTLTAEVTAELMAPPEEHLWGEQALKFEEAMLVTILTHPKLMGSIGAKWVMMAPPSEEEYAELIKIGLEQKTKLPARAGQGLFDRMAGSIEKALRKG